MPSPLGRLKRQVPLLNVRPALGDLSRRLTARLWDFDKRLRAVQEALGRIEARQVADLPPTPLDEASFRVYSQWGEDGIIQRLVREVTVPRPVFVEFGVEDYEEANTRFLLTQGRWSGLVLEGDPEQVAAIRCSDVYWRHNLKAAQAFITRDNINDLLREHGVTGPIGLLSIDIDGMDYWIWDAIDAIEPAIVICEYNSLFGPDEAVTVPYDPAFDRRAAHHSLLYYGASLAALCRLAQRKGYDFVGAGRSGLNAFFVHQRLRPASLPALSAREGFVPGSFCEYHDPQGRRVKLSREAMQAVLRDLPLEHVAS
jgi:hypothetical protein